MSQADQICQNSEIMIKNKICAIHIHFYGCLHMKSKEINSLFVTNDLLKWEQILNF